MKNLTKRFLTGLAIIAGVALSISAHAATIDFSGLSNGTFVTNQYAGVVFSLIGGPDSSGAPVTNNYNGEGLANSTNPDYPTANILDIAFTSPVSNVSFTFNNNGGSSTFYTAFNASNGVVDTNSLPSGNAFVPVTVTGSGISDLQLNNGTAGNSNWYFAIQQLSFDQASVSPVPLPSTWGMLIVGLMGLTAVSYRRQKAPSKSI